MRAVESLMLVGGPDIDTRLALMELLGESFDVSAVGSSKTLRERFQADGFAYHSYHLSRQVNPLADLLTAGQLAIAFHRLKPKIVHAFDTKPGIWGCLAARIVGVPIVIGTLTGLGSLYANDSLTTRLTRIVYRWLQQLACKASDVSIFQNRDDANQLIALGVAQAHKSQVILGSGVDTSLFDRIQVSDSARTQVRADLKIRSTEVVVIMISRIIRSKGVLEFANAARTVLMACPTARFILVGSEDKNSIERLDAEEMHLLKQSVTWLGARQDISTLLSISDILVLPTTYGEGIPRVLLEGASMGLPIIATDTAGCKDVVKDGINGYLVPVCDSAVLSQSILRLINQPKLRSQFGLNSRRRAVEHFDLSVIAGQTQSIYRQLLIKKGLLKPDLA